MVAELPTLSAEMLLPLTFKLGLAEEDPATAPAASSLTLPKVSAMDDPDALASTDCLDAKAPVVPVALVTDKVMPLVAMLLLATDDNLLLDKVNTEASSTLFACKRMLDDVLEVPTLDVRLLLVLVWLLAKADVATTVLLAPITAPLSSKVNAGAVKLVLVRVTWLVTVLAIAEDLSSLSVTVNLAPSEILAADAPS